MTETIDSVTRQQIRDFLPIAISKTVESYNTFIQVLDNTSPENFLSHHNACKAAIAHLEHLLKLARIVNASDNGGDDDSLQNFINLSGKRVEKNRNDRNYNP